MFVRTDSRPQISLAYWRMVASLEKRLPPMMLWSAMRDQAAGSA